MKLPEEFSHDSIDGVRFEHSELFPELSKRVSKAVFSIFKVPKSMVLLIKVRKSSVSLFWSSVMTVFRYQLFFLTDFLVAFLVWCFWYFDSVQVVPISLEENI